jgi:hypothetical protein
VTERKPEDRLFGARPPGGEPEPPQRRESRLLARNPVFAVLMLVVAGWLLAQLWPDVDWFFSEQEAIDLGGPGTYHLERARENRLVRIRGDLVQAVPVLEGRSGAPRTVGRVEGTSLVVDRPGRDGPPVHEGRLLPAGARADYGAAAAAMRERGAILGDRFPVLREGERPRTRWLPVAASAIVAALAAVNLRALLRRLLPRGS